MAGPSPAVQRVVGALRDLTSEHGHPPTVREIAAFLGLASSTVCIRLDQAENYGLIRRTPGKFRTLTVVETQLQT